ncbi:histidine ammonia-lyase [Streptacidiphilus pinicola]|uniref:Histidine ammonia-lyase n=1 Tax=Streptacidiphilus pinicola TaxID=2219663 RepID=A0A2X0ICD6_9ACTN|nr:aromatic amino acid ammonia-lyase [Streptacidiphilus pinicola]RAG82624.1 histidine ammonia-lyase [Streptacidiphilus pinicola]
MTAPHPDAVCFDGASLTADQVTALARTLLPVHLDPQARARVTAARSAAVRATARRPVYGHSTGVGANRTTALDEEATRAFGLRLLRSHAGGIGPLVPVEQSRAMLAVRLNQLLGAGSAIDGAVVDALAQALTSGHVPEVHALGSLGTADLTALAELGLTLAGEQPWQPGVGLGEPPRPLVLNSWDALPLLSSSALTIGQAALAATDLRTLLDRLPLVAALSLTAVRGSLEPFAEAVHARRPHPGAQEVSRRVSGLLACADWSPSLVQDPFGFRCLPQVHGAALDAWNALDRVLTVELNASAENPLLDGDDYYHHGGFHQASLALALDQMRLGLLGTAQLTTARQGALNEPAFTGLPPFLAEAENGSSGLMITEYAAHSAFAELRGTAQPVTLGHTVISRGVEEHASFAATAARRLTEAVDHFRLILACELVAAVRALRMQERTAPGDGELSQFHHAAAAVLDPDLADHKLTEDVHSAAALLRSVDLGLPDATPPVTPGVPVQPR